MNNRHTKPGLTLIELLIAMAMVVAIISMVNAGFFAASRSAETCTDKMLLDWQQLRLLDSISGQIRCAFAPAQSKTACFEYRPGNILHFLTTRPFALTKDENVGPLEVDYRFDPDRNALLLSQRRFVETSADNPLEWQEIAGGINNFGLQFYDGRQWLDRWDSDSQKNLPSAVRITIKYQQADLGEQQCTTSAFVFLSGANRQTVLTEIASEQTK